MLNLEIKLSYIVIHICLGVWVFVCLYLTSIKTAEPIGPKIFVGLHMSQGMIKIFIKFKFVFYKIHEHFCFYFTMYTKRKCSQLEWKMGAKRPKSLVYILCLSVCLSVCIQWTSKRLNQSGPNFVWCLTWPRMVYGCSELQKIVSNIFDFSKNLKIQKNLITSANFFSSRQFFRGCFRWMFCLGPIMNKIKIYF